MTGAEVSEWIVISETGVGMLSAIVFCCWYVFKLFKRGAVPNEHGWFMLSLGFVFGCLFALILANRAFGAWYGRTVVSVGLYTALILIVFWMPRLVYISYRGKNRKTSTTKES